MGYGSVESLFNVELKIADDGEIIAKGPSIMKGYYNNKEATNEVLETNGWFHTGDIGEFDGDGFLKITDRRKYFSYFRWQECCSSTIGESLITSPYIEQVVVIGDKSHFALVYLHLRQQQLSCRKRKEVSSDAALIEHSDVISLINKEVSSAMDGFSRFERIKKSAYFHVINS